MLQFVVWFESIWIVHVHFAGWKFGQFSVRILATSTVILLGSFGFISQEVPDVLPVLPGEAWDCLIWERGCHPIFWSFPEPFLMSLHLDRCTRINMQINIDTSRYCIDIHLTCHWWFKRNFITFVVHPSNKLQCCNSVSFCHFLTICQWRWQDTNVNMDVEWSFRPKLSNQTWVHCNFTLALTRPITFPTCISEIRPLVLEDLGWVGRHSEKIQPPAKDIL